MNICQIRGNLILLVTNKAIPSQVASHVQAEGVETRRQTPHSEVRGRYSPAYKPERDYESNSKMHNRLVPGSSPGGPTNNLECRM